MKFCRILTPVDFDEDATGLIITLTGAHLPQTQWSVAVAVEEDCRGATGLRGVGGSGPGGGGAEDWTGHTK